MKELCRHDFKDKLTPYEIIQLFNSIGRHVNPIRVKTSWVMSKNKYRECEMRVQTNVYNHDEVVKVFQDKIDSNPDNKRWINAWGRNLRQINEATR